MTQIKRWWVGKYNLPANHALFLDRPLPEWSQEMYEDLFAQRDAIERDLKEGGGDSEQLLQSLARINKALEEADYIEDDLVDQWERDLEAGREPDLDAIPGG